MSDIQRYGEEFQRVGKNGFDASVRSLGELGKGFQAIRASMIDYTKKSFEDGTRAFEQLAGAKSIEQAWEIQSQYAKKAFEAYVAQASKIGEMYVDLARSAYQPVEQAVAKTALNSRRSIEVSDGGRVGRPGHEMVPAVLEHWERRPLRAASHYR